MTTRSLRFPTAGQVELNEHEDVAPDIGQLTTRARLSLISTGTELSCLRGEFDDRTNWSEWVQYPFSPGYSMVSEVIAVRQGVTGFTVGDRICSPTPHTSRPLVDAREAVMIPEDLPDDVGVWASLAVTTQWAVRRAGVQLGERVAVIGAGMLGQLLVQYLHIAGAREIFVVDRDDTHLFRALAGGATEVMCAPVDDLVLSHAGRFDAVFEVTGFPGALAPSSELVRPMGRLILVGDTPQPHRQHLGPRTVADGITIMGVHSGTTASRPSATDPWTVATMLEVFFSFVRDGRMRLDELVTHRITPADAPALYREMLSDRGGRLGILIDWSSTS